jgi:hypothetical protein
VILRKLRELAAAVEAHPFDDSSQTHVAFLAERPAKAGSLLGVPATLRNWRTVVALAQLAAEG